MKKLVFRIGVAFFTLTIGITVTLIGIVRNTPVLQNVNKSLSINPPKDLPKAEASLNSHIIHQSSSIKLKINKGSLPCLVNRDDIEAVKELINAGIDINSIGDSCINSEPSPRGVTLLMESAQWGDISLVSLLIENGANVNASDSWGRSPLYYAAANIEIIDLLVKNGADVNAKSEGERTLLMCQANPEIVKYYLDKGVDINAKDWNGTTAVMTAAGNNRPEVVRVLLERGADLTLKDKAGRTASDYEKKGFPNEYLIVKM